MNIRKCREMTNLISQQHDRTLTWRERCGLRIHLLLCGKCRRYQRQLAQIQAAMKWFKL